ncbi:MAG TPA: hypothetical protein VN791_04485 [Acidimicrobiales bacterium]|nr:hypothetical protein [Acidimicrobiales bacterium]
MQSHRRAVMSTVLFTVVVAMTASLILFLGSTAQAAGRSHGSASAKTRAVSPLGEVLASDAWPGADFGWSVAVSGSTAVVGAPYANSYTGAAYVFTDSGGTWTQQAELTAGDGAPGDEFGWSVAISGSTVVVGAPDHYFGIGAAYVFSDSGGSWADQAELTPSGLGVTSEVKFGYSVVTSGAAIMVGADGYDAKAGAVFVFTDAGGTWNQEATLTPADAGVGQEFGWSMAVSGPTLLVSAVKAHDDTGAVYVFSDAGGAWAQDAELTASDAAGNNYFGDKVAISGSRIVAGAPGHDSEQGAAYVFTGSGASWRQVAELTASDGGPDDCFGWAVGVSGKTVLVGAEQTNADSGAAYMFTTTGSKWRQRAELAANDGGTTDEFGYSASLSGTTAIIGADGAEAGAGSAFLYTL